MQILLQNGHVYQNEAFVNADVLIKDNKIAAIGKIKPSSEMKVIDITGKIVTPGLVDVHVHYRDPGQTYKENVHSGSLAAAHGGFTTVCAMANVEPVPNGLNEIKSMIEHNRKESIVHIFQYAPITEDLTSDKLIDYQAMKNAGVCGFSNDGHGVQKGGTMFQAMKHIQKTGLPLAEHIEDDSLKFDGVMNAGENAEKLGLSGILSECESAQLARDLVLAARTKVHYHACHVSTKESVELIRLAKQHGVNVTCEVAPHHLLLTDDMITKDDAYFKMNPPLRTKEDQAALIEGLLDGTIDMIATDHAPHSKEEKQHGFKNACFGITGSETAFASLYTKFVKNNVFTLTQLVNWMAIKPASLFNLKDAGMLRISDQADIAVFDLNHPFELNENDFLSKGKNTPFVNTKLFGKTVLTFVSGKIAYSEEGVK
ncbi:dihydroorotase [Ligilactobacillus cholophilus]|uniref:dihydroorotase n=1 Tax=Ligilactobacillus cholophilus TaxID=3050131 RepID=UPI0025B0DDCD|nr:dihydroorotase [Ligilactobacillus cholophilus]